MQSITRTLAAEPRAVLRQVIRLGVVSSLVAAVILTTAMTYLYRQSVVQAEDRLSLARATDVLNAAVVPIAERKRAAPHAMADLAMTVSHVRALVPAVQGVTIRWPDGTQMYGAGHGRMTKIVPLVDRSGTHIADVSLVLAESPLLDAPTIAFIVSITLAALLLAAAPQLVLARRALRELARQREAAESAYVATLVSLVASLELRDAYTADHSKRVANYAVTIARTMELDEYDIAAVRDGALLHDLGKIGVPDSVLLKPGPLTAEERATIGRHPRIGAGLLETHDRLANVRDCVLHHHERLDGNGYPDGLTGETIPLSARIVAVADSYDAMTTDRPYRARLTHDVAMARLAAGAGKQWDAACVAALTRALASRIAA